MSARQEKQHLHVFANYAVAAAESMAYSQMRTAHSTFVKETQDFSCGILTPEGATFASPVDLGSTWLVGMHYGPLIAYFDDYAEGDVCFTNDSYSGYVASHTPDIHMWKPVFWGGELVCFVASHNHHTDMGGAVPASLSRALTEIQQEGVRVKPTRLMRQGELNREVIDFIMTNVRSPEQSWGDLKAQISALNVGERKIHEMIGRFGIEAFRRGMYEVMDYAEQQARATLSTIPEGEYFFADYADEDAPGGYPCRIALTMTVRNGELVLDFTGSDPQLQSSLNLPTGGRERHALVVVAIPYILYTLNPSQLLNYGLLRAVRCVLPKGSVLNPEHPAAVGMRSIILATIFSTIMGAFSQAAPRRLPAAPAGALTVMNVRTTSLAGDTIMASIGPIGGGAGGDAGGDGNDGSGANFGFLRNMPVELLELEIPINIHSYGLAPDSGGAGLHRGGTGVQMTFQLENPNSTVTARNRDRSRFVAWGVQGGKAGVASSFVLNPGTERERQLENTDVVAVSPDDVVRVTGPGGGGYGDPLLRDPRQVLLDVRNGLVSTEAAARLYGVALRDGEVDAEATSALRAGHVEDRSAFDFGAYRERFEAVLTPERYDTLTGLLAAVPLTWRYFVKHRVFDSLLNRPDMPAGADGVLRAYAEVRDQFRKLPAYPPSGSA